VLLGPWKRQLLPARMVRISVADMPCGAKGSSVLLSEEPPVIEQPAARRPTSDKAASRLPTLIFTPINGQLPFGPTLRQLNTQLPRVKKDGNAGCS